MSIAEFGIFRAHSHSNLHRARLVAYSALTYTITVAKHNIPLCTTPNGRTHIEITPKNKCVPVLSPRIITTNKPDLETTM